MKIYLDGLFYKQTGIGRYYSGLLKLLAENGFELVTTVPQRFESEWLKEFSEYSKLFPLFVKYEKFAILHTRHLSAILEELEKECQLFWFPHVNLPLYVPKNTIVTIHDLCPLTRHWNRFWVRKKLFYCTIKRAVDKARVIVVPSNFVKEELIKHFPKAEEKVQVLYNFIEDKFIEVGSKKKNPIIKDNCILFVGNRKKHKNLKNLLIAYSQIKDQINCKLVIAGARDKNRKKDEIDSLIKSLNIRSHVIEFNNPPDEIIINLYQHAKLFVFPSLYEGFGYPPLEALACRCPVITSNIPVLREILGDEIACFDPNSVEDIKDRLLEAIKNKERREEILRTGKLLVQKFSTRSSTKQWIEILGKV